jgi:hypothetical protein
MRRLSRKDQKKGAFTMYFPGEMSGITPLIKIRGTSDRISSREIFLLGDFHLANILKILLDQFDTWQASNQRNTM